MALAKWGGLFDPFSSVFYWAGNSFKDQTALKKSIQLTSLIALADLSKGAW
jgi:hypothetical protein